MDQSRINQQAVTTWLSQHAVPLWTLEPDKGFDDLLPLRPLLNDATIIGLGEATHGTHEFFRFKHRMIRFLVLELGFTVFAMEASYSAGRAVHDVLFDGSGDLDTALSEMGYIAWDTEEVLELLRWLRDYNRHVPDDRKVRFYGLDYTYNDNGRREVERYLEDVAPDWASRITPVFRVLASAEANWPMQIDDRTRELAQQVLPELHELVAYLDARRNQLAGEVSVVGLDHIVRLCRVMLQSAAFDNNNRSRHMGENLLALMASEIGDRKVVYWGHNYHVGVETFSDKPATFGHVIRDRYGESYVALALEFGEGEYQARSAGPDGLAAIRVVTVPPAPDGTLPWYLAGAGIGDFIVMLRDAVDEPAIQEWLTTPLLAHAMIWVATDPEWEYETASIRYRYDGIVFTGRSTPVRPTASAKDHASRGLRL